ncbi:MAG: protease pro-enzyme activation domain-containing protein [Ktedonobacterales bacterium]
MKRALVASAAAAILVALLGIPGGGDSLRARFGASPAARGTHATVRVAPLPPTFPMEISLVLRGQHPTALSATLSALEDPRSPLYHHFLTPSEFTRLFGPSAAGVERVAGVLQASGLQVDSTRTSNSLLVAHGPAAAVEALFGVEIDKYRTPSGEQYYTASGTPHVPATLAAYVSGVMGLDSRRHIQTRPLLAHSSAPGPGEGLEPADLARAYDFASLQANGLNGTNETIALAEIDTFSTTDIADYDSAFGISAPPVQVISVGGGAQGNSPEATLDIEVVHAVAPHAHILVYEGGQDLSQLAQIFNQMVTDHRAQIMSISLGACEGQLGGSDGQSFINSLTSTFQQADAEGISVLAASGDSGAYGCQDNTLSVSLPASSPYVTAVGGTTLFLSSDGSYGYEAGWEGPLEGAGTGGGLSQIYSRPSWQTGPGVLNSYTNGMREVPDVAADADPLTGYLIYFSGWQVAGGTSASSPLWAGLIALADQSAAASGKPALGFLNPALYSLGNSSGFHDVTIGGNLYYSATPGWNYATGWGSPDAAVLIPALVRR